MGSASQLKVSSPKSTATSSDSGTLSAALVLVENVTVYSSGKEVQHRYSGPNPLPVGRADRWSEDVREKQPD